MKEWLYFILKISFFVFLVMGVSFGVIVIDAVSKLDTNIIKECVGKSLYQGAQKYDFDQCIESAENASKVISSWSILSMILLVLSSTIAFGISKTKE